VITTLRVTDESYQPRARALFDQLHSRDDLNRGEYRGRVRVTNAATVPQTSENRSRVSCWSRVSYSCRGWTSIPSGRHV